MKFPIFSIGETKKLKVIVALSCQDINHKRYFLKVGDKIAITYLGENLFNFDFIYERKPIKCKQKWNNLPARNFVVISYRKHPSTKIFANLK